jgi:hypothetical protein
MSLFSSSGQNLTSASFAVLVKMDLGIMCTPLLPSTSLHADRRDAREHEGASRGEMFFGDEEIDHPWTASVARRSSRR